MKLETRKRYLFDTQNNYLWLCMTFHTNLCCKRVNLPKFFVNRFLSEYPYDIDLISYIFTVFFYISLKCEKYSNLESDEMPNLIAFYSTMVQV